MTNLFPRNGIKIKMNEGQKKQHDYSRLKMRKGDFFCLFKAQTTVPTTHPWRKEFQGMNQWLAG